jgi:hypothetical protein
MTGTMPNIVDIPMYFAWQGVCVMLCNSLPTNFSGHKKVCVIRGYALSEVCVKRGSTVAVDTDSA